jgi:hypothetical protein
MNVRLRTANRRWRHDHLNKSGRHIINEAGDQPLGRERGNCPERSNVDSNRGARIGDGFCLESLFLCLKIVHQQGGLARKPSHAAIGVLKYDDVKLPAASRNPSGNLTDSPEQS